MPPPIPSMPLPPNRGSGGQHPVPPPKDPPPVDYRLVMLLSKVAILLGYLEGAGIKDDILNQRVDEIHLAVLNIVDNKG